MDELSDREEVEEAAYDVGQVVMKGSGPDALFGEITQVASEEHPIYTVQYQDGRIEDIEEGEVRLLVSLAFFGDIKG